MNKKWINVSLLSCLPGLLFCCILFADSRIEAQTQAPGAGTPPSAMRQSSPDAHPNSNSQRQPKNQEPRQDYYYGTFNGGIVMDTDPQTGTRIIQVTPPPEEEKESNSDNTYIISPEIKLQTK